MKVIVCGSLGYGGAERIKWLQHQIRKMGYEVLDQIFSVEGMDYTHITDFRDKPELVEKITKHDLEWIAKADVMVVYGNRPSVGTAIEMVEARNNPKKITTLLYASEELRSPWYMYVCDVVVINLIDLQKELNKIAEDYYD